MHFNQLNYLLNKIFKKKQSESKIKKIKKCILHIGTEKTGTSTIQSFLANNRNQFACEKVLYPNVSGSTGGSQWEFAAYAIDRPWEKGLGEKLNIFNESDRDKFRSELLNKFTNEVHKHGYANLLIISSEHFHSRLNTIKEIEKLKNFLHKFVDTVEVLLYVRRQDRLAISYYSTKLKNAAVNPVVFPIKKEDSLPYYFDYEKIFNNWRTVFGQKAMHVRIFDSSEFQNGNLLEDFCSALGLNIEGKSIPGPVNESFNQIGANFLLAVNRHYAGKSSKERDTLCRFISDNYSGKNYPASRAEAFNFYQQFKDSNERLRCMAFPCRTKPLFDEDFYDYPEENPSLVTNYEDAIEVAIKIWQVIGKK